MRRSPRLCAVLAVSALVAAGLDAAVPTLAMAAVPPAAVTPTSPDERPDLVSAGLLARTSGRRVEVTGLRDETSTTWVNPDGTRTTDVAIAPIRVRRPDGSLADVDATLHASGGRVRPAALPVDMSFSAGGDTTLASLVTGGKSARVGWSSPLPEPTVHGISATYADVSPGVDLVVSTQRFGFEVDLRLKTRPTAPVEVHLPTTLTGLSMTEAADHGLRLTDGTGKLVASGAEPAMWDATTDPRTGASTARPVDMSVAPRTGGTEIVLRPDMAFLSDPATVYPVTIDPPISFGVNADTWIQSNVTAAQSSSTELRVGNPDATNRTRSYLQWLLPNWSGANTRITSATMKLWNWWSPSCTSYNVAVNPVTQVWNYATATWASGQPTVDSASVYQSGGTTLGAAGCPAGYLSWNVTDLVAGWTAGTFANNGVRIASGDGVTGNYKRLSSSDTPYNSNMPMLSATYNTYPASVGVRSQTPATTYTAPGGPTTTYVTSRTPTLGGSATDADGGTVRVDYEIWNSALTTLIASGSSAYVASGAAGTWTVPGLTQLTDGATYKWRAKGYDGTDTSKAYSSWMPFTVDVTPPAAPSSITSTQYSANAWHTAGGPGTFTWSDASTDVDHYLWGLDVPTPADSVSTGSVTIDPMPDGWHVLSVRAVDKAGNVGVASSFAFGASPQVTTPEAGARTQSALPLNARAMGGYSYVTYKYRKNSTDPFVPLPPGDVTDASVPLTAWPIGFSTEPGSPDSAPPSLVWALASTLGTDGSAEVQVCFGVTSTTVTACSLIPTKVTLDTNEYGASYATVQLVPGTLSALTGNFAMDETDADISIAGEGLSLHRTLNSKTPTTPSNGIFGDGWTSSLPTTESGDWARLMDNGDSVLATSSDGTLSTFAKTATGYEVTGNAQASGLVLVAGSTGTYGPAAFTMTDEDGNVTTFGPAPALTHSASSAAPNQYQVSSFDEPGSEMATTYSYSGGNVEAIVLPHDAAVTCTYSVMTHTWSTVSEGCHAMQLSYSGGHVTAVTYVTTEPTAGTPLYVDIACYAYTGNKLTSVWDPRVGVAGTGNHPITCGTPILAKSYAYDAAGRLSAVTPPGLRPFVIGYDGSGRISTVSRQHAAPWGSGTETTTVVYGVSLAPDVTHPEYRPDMRTASVATWSEHDVPTNATAVFTPGTTPSSDDMRDAAVLYMDVYGRTVNTATYSGSGASGWHVGTSEYDEFGRAVRSLSPSNREEALSPTTGAGAALGLPSDTAAAAAMVDAQSDYNHDGLLTDTFGPYHLTAIDDGTGGVTSAPAREHTHFEYDDGTEIGNLLDVPFGLEVLRTTGASMSGSAVATAEKDVRTTKTEYALSETDNIGWLLRSPMRVTTDPGAGHLALTTVTRYDEQTGAPTESWSPKASDPSTPTGDVDKYKTRTMYFAAPSGTAPDDVSNCLKRAWVALPCKVQRVAQPGVPGLPTLPTTTFIYDYLARPTTVTGRVIDGAGATRERIATTTFTPSEYSPRVKTTTTTGVGVDVPAVTTSYDSTTGLPVTTSAAATAELAASTMSTGYDDFGRETTFTDADYNQTTTTYDGTSGRLTSLNDGQGTYTYGYNGGGEHRGLVTSVSVSGISGSFTATYDAESRMVAQAMPSGMTETFARDETGKSVGLHVERSGNTWLDETARPSIHKQIRLSTGGGRSEAYSYDAAGRLVKVQDTSSDAGCATRMYTYDAHTNRTSSTTYPADAGNGNACQSTTGNQPVMHAYDAADRLSASGTDTGLVYDAFGRVTTLPANNPGGTVATIEYYTTDLVRKQTQGVKEMTWALDPALRPRTYSEKTNGMTTSVRTNHYSDRNGDSPTWIDEGGGAWTRAVAGLGGTLSATLDSIGTLMYQVGNLHGDVVAVGSATATTPDETFGADEFGNPTDTVARRYAWLGGEQRTHDALGGVVLMGVRLYAPALGRFLQPDPLPGGSCNAYEYACQDPVNLFDLDGRAVGTTAADNPCGSPACWCVIGILLGKYDVPSGFMSWARKRSSRYSIVVGPRGHQGRGDGHCSSPLGDTGASFNFRFSCQVHDLGYDLMRFFRSSGYRGSTRKSVDLQLLNEMRYHCSTRGIWTRSRCYFWAEVYFDAVALNSVRQGYGVP